VVDQSRRKAGFEGLVPVSERCFGLPSSLSVLVLYDRYVLVLDQQGELISRKQQGAVCGLKHVFVAPRSLAWQAAMTPCRLSRYSSVCARTCTAVRVPGKEGAATVTIWEPIPAS